MGSVIGWDIGGAHLKAARAEDGVIVAALQIVCTPHSGLSFLEKAIDEAAAAMGGADRHAITMTAELSDAFETREKGVATIAAICSQRIKTGDIMFYAGAKGFLPRAANLRGRKRHCFSELARQRLASSRARAPTRCLSIWVRRQRISFRSKTAP